MTPLKLFCLSLAAAGLLAAIDRTWAANPVPADFSGIWRLDDQHSDSPIDIAGRLHAEKKRELAAAQQPASAASTSAPVASPASTSHAGRGGGGHGMGGGGMGGGHGHGGGRGGQNARKSADDSDAPAADRPPPLLDNDALLNVQQDAKSLRVAFSDTDRLDARLDGLAHQSLNGSAVVQTRTSADGLMISMQFDDGTRLEQLWVKSPDGHHLMVTEQWTTTAVKQPILFRRSYDRLDI